MLVSVLIFIAVLSILVLVHEFGHFVIARRAGVWVEEFGFGIPPRIFGKKIGQTLYSINLLPFGGFVRLHGENTEESVKFPEKAFLNKPRRTRASIVLAGVVMNFLLALFSFSLVYSFVGVPRDTGRVKVVEVIENSPAQVSGIKIDDVIREVDSRKVFSNEEFIEAIEEKKGEEVTLSIERKGYEGLVKIVTTPRAQPPEEQGALGILISSSETYFPPIWQRPFYGVYYGFKEALFWGGVVVAGFVKIIADLFRGVIPSEVAGPVGIFALTSQAASFGVTTLINFIGILSVNLAILNIIPFPALDGGRLLFIIIESIFGKKVVPKVEAAIHTVGMVILIILILAITAHDIQRLIQAGGVAGYLDSVLK